MQWLCYFSLSGSVDSFLIFRKRVGNLKTWALLVVKKASPESVKVEKVVKDAGMLSRGPYVFDSIDSNT